MLNEPPPKIIARPASSVGVRVRLAPFRHTCTLACLPGGVSPTIRVNCSMPSTFWPLNSRIDHVAHLEAGLGRGTIFDHVFDFRAADFRKLQCLGAIRIDILRADALDSPNSARSSPRSAYADERLEVSGPNAAGVNRLAATITIPIPRPVLISLTHLDNLTSLALSRRSRSFLHRRFRNIVPPIPEICSSGPPPFNGPSAISSGPRRRIVSSRNSETIRRLFWA